VKKISKLKAGLTVAAITGMLATSGVAIAGSDTGWISKTLGSKETTLNSVAVDDGADAVTVGKGGKIYYNTDITNADMTLASWLQGAVPVATDLNAVAKLRANDNFIAVGASGVVLLSSDDGKTWTKAKDLLDSMTSEDFTYVVTNGAGQTIVASANRLFYSANPVSTTPAWRELFLTEGGNNNGEALDVKGNLKGLAYANGQFWAFGAGSTLSPVNPSGASNTQITNLKTLEVDYDGDGTGTPLGSVILTGMLHDGNSYFLTTANGKILDITISGSLASPTTSKYTWAEISGNPSITSIAKATNTIFCTTSNGDVYRLAGKQDFNVWDKISTLSELNSVVATGQDGVAVGNNGVITKGEGVKWTFQEFGKIKRLRAIGNNFFAYDLDIAFLKYGVDPANITGTSISLADFSQNIITRSGNYLVVGFKNGANYNGLNVVAADGSSVSGGVKYTQNSGLGSFGSGAAVFNDQNGLVAFNGCGNAPSLSLTLSPLADYARPVNVTYDSTEEHRFSVIGATANNRVWGFVGVGAHLYYTDGSTLDTTNNFQINTQLTSSQVLTSATHLYAPGGKYVYAYNYNTTDFYVIPQDLTAADLTSAEDLAKYNVPRPNSENLTHLFGDENGLYALIKSLGMVYKLILNTESIKDSQWVEYGATLIHSSAFYNTGAAIGNKLIVAKEKGIRASTQGALWGTLGEKSSSTTNINDVSSSTDTFYVVGDNSLIYSSKDGSTWTPDTAFIEKYAGANLNFVRTYGNNLYAVDGTNKNIYKHNGSTWEKHLSKSYSAVAKDIIVNGENRGLILSATQVYDLSDYSSKEVSGLTTTANAFAQLSDNKFLIVGNAGKIWTYDGDKTATAVTYNNTSKILNDVYTVSSSEAYIVGDSGYFAKYDGANVIAIPTGSTVAEDKSFTKVWANDDNVFLASGADVYRYDGFNIFKEQTGTTSTVNGLAGNTAAKGFVAVGDTGAVLFRKLNSSGVVLKPSQTNLSNLVPTASTVTVDSLHTKYGVDNATVKLLGDQMSFSADIDTTKGNTGTFGFSFTATENASNTNQIGLLKLLSTDKSKQQTFSFNQTAEVSTNPREYWITSITPNSEGDYTPLKGDLTVGKGYYVWFNIQDNGKGDTNPTAGKITDPVVATTTGGQTGSSSNSSGCVFNPAAGFGLEWLLLMATPVLAVIRNHFKK